MVASLARMWFGLSNFQILEFLISFLLEWHLRDLVPSLLPFDNVKEWFAACFIGGV